MTKTKSPIQLLEAAIESALIAAEPGAQIEAQARLLIREEKELIDLLTPEWQLQEVIRLIRLKRLELAKKRHTEDQFLLPGFERIPQRIMIREGKRRPLEKATYRQLRDYFEFLRKRERNNPRITQVKALMERVWKYARETPGITVREVCEREAQGA